MNYHPSSKKNPCPVCGRTKDQDCRTTELGNLVYCHTHQQFPKDHIQNGYRFLYQSQKGAGWGLWVKETDRKAEKKLQPEVETIYHYKDRAGNDFIRVHRQKGREPEFWQSYLINGNWYTPKQAERAGLRDRIEVMRREVPIYRYGDVQDAIAQGKPIFWVEGEKVARALWSLGIPATTSIGGCKAYKSWGDYQEDLKGAEVVICPDRDQVGMDYAEQVYQDFPEARWCYAFPRSPLWNITLPKAGGLDLFDWIADGASKEQILMAVEPKREQQEFTPLQYRLMTEYQIVERVLSDRIRLNTLKHQVEIDGDPINLDRIRLDFALDYGIYLKSNKEEAITIVQRLAEKNSYNPVVEYLQQVYRIYGNDTSILDGIAERYFGQTAPIYQAFIRKTLIAAVARAMQPGCKVDTTLILQGRQGTFKSTFFKTLAGKWFDDSFGSPSDKDERLKLHSTWIIEWAELETVFRRKDISATKAFLSSSIDAVRRPYGRAIEEMHRRSIIVGTTNEDEFLHDSTGNRRFWIIPVLQHIPIDLLTEERDRIWAAAYAAWAAGEEWILNREHEAQSQLINGQFETIDPWFDYVQEYSQDLDRDYFTIREFLEQKLKMEPARITKADEMRVSACLRRLGWKKKSRRIDGKLIKVWVSPPVLPPVTTSSEGGNTSETLATSSLIPPLPPSTTSSKTSDLRSNKKEGTEGTARKDLGKVGQQVVLGGNTPSTPDIASNSADTTPKKQVVSGGNKGGFKVVTPQGGNSSPLKKGDHVRYVGTKWKEAHGNEDLIFNDVDGIYANCIRPNGQITTWLEIKDLRKHDA